MVLPLLHHPDPAAVRTDPRGAIGYPPLVLLKTGVAYLESTGTTPAKWLFLAATVALELLLLTAAARFVLFPFRLHMLSMRPVRLPSSLNNRSCPC